MVTATSQLKFWDKWIHKIWHNFLGSLLGWIILYYLLHKYLMNHYNYKVELTNVDLFLVFFAFIGVTGFIPTALIGIAQSLSSLFEKALDYATKK